MNTSYIVILESPDHLYKIILSTDFDGRIRKKCFRYITYSIP